ncbi:hypothetical protein ACLOJK_001471 [Asimina triloba]
MGGYVKKAEVQHMAEAEGVEVEEDLMKLVEMSSIKNSIRIEEAIVDVDVAEVVVKHLDNSAGNNQVLLTVIMQEI